MKKPRRNEPCHCGSGKKFKKCHGSFSKDAATDLPSEVWNALDQQRKEAHALRVQREKQQGLGRPIVSTVVGDHRVVAVGMTLHSQKADRWKTFHVFLSDHFLSLLGSDWVKAEQKKPADEQHQIIRWLEQSGADLKRLGKTEMGVRSAPMTGAVRSYLNLAYNIYIIAHHTPRDKGIVKSYVRRLKSARSDDFIGALFETYAASAFLKAGFDLKFEDERDGSTSHVEFVATYPKTGASFSVEVKARDWKSATPQSDDSSGRKLRVARKLNQALAKRADHPRIVFIEVNIPDMLTAKELAGWPKTALREIRDNEKLNDQQSAYVIVTNHAFHNNLDAINSGTQGMVTGFNIPDFGPDVELQGYKSVLASRERHAEIFHLMSSIETHYEIPSAFDGEMSDLAFVGDGLPRLRFGRTYLVPSKDGVEVPGRFYEATVDVDKKIVYGVFELANGQHIMATVPLTDAEVSAYKRHPDTFFGEVRKPPRQATTLVELCDFFYEAYQKTERERLLEFMAGAPDYDELTKLPQKDLAITYAERLAVSAFNLKDKPSEQGNPPSASVSN